jgi:hypothetical protein
MMTVDGDACSFSESSEEHIGLPCIETPPFAASILDHPRTRLLRWAKCQFPRPGVHQNRAVQFYCEIIVIAVNNRAGIPDLVILRKAAAF